MTTADEPTPALADVTLWAKQARQATEKRNEAIAKARADGVALRTIGAAAGLSHTAIAKILGEQGGGGEAPST